MEEEVEDHPSDASSHDDVDHGCDERISDCSSSDTDDGVCHMSGGTPLEWIKWKDDKEQAFIDVNVEEGVPNRYSTDFQKARDKNDRNMPSSPFFSYASLVLLSCNKCNPDSSIRSNMYEISADCCTPASVIRHPSSVIRHPSSVIRHPSSVIRHPPHFERIRITFLRIIEIITIENFVFVAK